MREWGGEGARAMVGGGTGEPGGRREVFFVIVEERSSLDIYLIVVLFSWRTCAKNKQNPYVCTFLDSLRWNHTSSSAESKGSAAEAFEVPFQRPISLSSSTICFSSLKLDS